MDRAPRFDLFERQTYLPIDVDWFEFAVMAADKAFILAAGLLGLMLVALLVFQNVLG